MKETLQFLFEHRTLSKDQARSAFVDLAQGKANPSQMAAFMAVFIMRTITVEELEGFRDAMLELCVSIDLAEFDPIDLCGTGGDGKDTFNVSTTASFVVAGAGVAVAKHGNYGVSSAVGSSNILEHFGIKFSNKKDVLKKQIETAGICLLHAPLFHPAMKNVAPIRKELGLKTFFNMLGPLVNPCRPQKQMVGVYSLELARLYAYVFQKSSIQYTIVHSLGGYDEISLTSDVKIISNQSEKIDSPEDLGFQKLNSQDIISGKTIEDSAKIFLNVLNNEATQAQKNVVLVNAAMAIQTAMPQLSWQEAIDKATESLASKKALDAFKTLLNFK